MQRKANPGARVRRMHKFCEFKVSFRMGASRHFVIKPSKQLLCGFASPTSWAHMFFRPQPLSALPPNPLGEPHFLEQCFFRCLVFSFCLVPRSFRARVLLRPPRGPRFFLFLMGPQAFSFSRWPEARFLANAGASQPNCPVLFCPPLYPCLPCGDGGGQSAAVRQPFW